MKRATAAVGRHLFVFLVGGLVLLAALTTRAIDSRQTAVPVPLPVYQIEAVSGDHVATLPLLNIAPLGVIPVPTPVDVDGDLLPDVTVAVNLVDVAGLFGNPTDLGAILAPNLEINRFLPGLPLTPVNPPLRINMKLTVLDAEGGDPTILRLGYETGPGGSIPATFKATASGLTGFFNPVEASVAAPGYEGPLTLVAGLESGDERVDADVRFSPLPGGLQFSYGSDDAGQHLGVAHGGAAGTTAADREVDLDADVTVREGDEVSTVDARVDRLPRTVDVTILPGGDDGGGFDYTANADGRLPDIRVDVNGRSDDKPLVARLDLEGLPPALHADWSLPEDGPAHVRVEAPVRPIGAVQARVADFVGNPNELPPYVPTAQQFLDMRQDADETERLVTGRVEGISLVDFTENERGLDAAFESAGGGQPLELHASLGAVGESKRRLDATTTISPLPAALSASLTDAGDDESTDPLTIVYTSSDSIDVDGHLEVRDEGVGADVPCGDDGTICTDLAVRDIPTRIETRIADLGSESRVEIDAEPREGASEPDVFADVIFGQDDDVPLVAHAEALDIPPFMRIRAAEGADETLSRAEFHACDFDYSLNSCAPGTEDPLGLLAFSLRNFLDRPAGFPVQILTSPNDAAVAARGRAGDPDVVDFAASGRLHDISEVTLIDEDGLALRTRVGGGQELHASVDLAGIRFDEEEANLFDIRGDATVASVPENFDLCFRGGPELPDDGADPIFAPCDGPDPFLDGEELEDAPVSLAYRATNGPADDPQPANIDIETELHLVEHAAEPVDDRRVDATLNITDLPSEATAHILVPAEDEGGPVRAVYDTGQGTGTEPTTISFAARVADGNLVCEDPRQPADEKKVFCVTGTIEGLPGRATFDYDPDVATDNILLTTSGPIDLTGLGLSMVKGELNDDDELVTSAVLVTGHVLDFPQRLSGTLHVPSDNADGNTAIDFDAEPSIGEISATVQNFVGADPLPTGAPPQRAGLPPIGPDYDTVTLLQQGDLLRAHAFITNLTHAGYRDHVTGTNPTSDPDKPEEVRTSVVSVGFSDNRPLRAYVNSDDGEKHVIADATVLDRPADLTLCFRGERQDAATVTVPTECDNATGKAAAFALATTPHEAGESLDINAFFRIAEQTGKILSGRVDIQDLPPLLRGNLDEGGIVTVEALGPDGDDDGDALDPASVGRMDFHVASFDITDDGYSIATRPFAPRTRGGGPFQELASATPSGKQHLGFATDDTGAIDLRGLVGPPTPGAPGARFSRLELDDDACAVPAGRDAEYPFYPPARPATDPLPLEYTCATVDLLPTSTAFDPMAISVVKDSDGERLAITGAELSDMPDHIQVTLAKTPEIMPITEDDDTEALRDPCGFADGSGNHSDDCLPPLLRFDTDAEAGSVLSGVLRKGPVALFDDLAAITEPGAEDLPPLQATPSAAGWNDWGGESARGLRALVGAFPQFDGSEPTVVHAAFRLDVPDSVTVRPVQTWSRESNTLSDFSSAKDLRLGYSVRRDGNVLDLGRLAVLYRTGSGDNIVLTDTAEAGLRENVATDEFEPREFREIPGELNLALYMREDKTAGTRLIQVDGRVDHATDLRARVFSAPEPPAESDSPFPFETLLTEPPPHPLTVDASILNLPGAGTGQGADGTTFRLRAELNLPDKTPPGGTEPPPDECPGFFNVDSCVKTNIVLTDVSAVFDFQPEGEGGVQGPPARLIKVFGQADGDSGLHIQAFRNVDAGATAEPDAELSAQVALLLDPFNISYEGQFLIFNADVELDGSFQPVLLLDHVSDFRLTARSSNLTGENIEHTGTEGFATVVPLMFLDDFDADVELDLWLFDVTVLGVDYVSEGLVQMDFEDCSASSKFFDVIGGLVDGAFYIIDDVLWDVLGFVNHDIGGISFGPGFGARSALVVPKAEDDPAFVLNVLGIPLIPDLGGAIMNLLDGILLCDEAPNDAFIDEHHPGDPLNIAGHPVPGAPLSEEPTPVDEQPVDEGPLTVAANTNATVCGRHRYSTVTIDGTLTVGGSGCPAAQASQLLLEAERVDVNATGSIVLPEGGTFLAVHAGNIVVDGLVQAIQGDIQLAASEVLLITPDGEVLADGSSPQVPINPDTGELWTGDFAEDRSGGGHRSDGGDRGAGGDGGAAYGNTSDRSPVTEAGGRGGPVNGGRGGGYIELRANSIGVDGTVSANGAPGVGGDCTVAGDGGGGGGAGGGISIASNSAFIDGSKLHADGGPGASGSLTDIHGAGGGSGGIIKVFSPILQGSAIPDPVGGTGGPGCQPEDEEADPGETGGNGGGGLVRRINTPQSKANTLTHTEDNGTVVDSFWHSPAEASLDLHVSAGTALPSGIDDFNIVACATMRQIEFADTNRRGTPDPDGPPKATEFVLPNQGQEFGDPCGDFHLCLGANCNSNNSAVMVGSTFVENTQVAVDEVITITNQSLTAACEDIRDEVWLTFNFDSDFPCPEAYWGAFTAIVVSDIPNNDCFDPDDAGEADDSEHCSLRETAPERPDVLFAVDVTDPVVGELTPVITGARVLQPIADDPSFVFTGDRQLQLTLDAGDQPELSGFQRAFCVELDASSDAPAVGFDCHPGPQLFRLRTPTDGKKTLVVFYFDAAGNFTTTNTEIILDRTPPQGLALPLPQDPDGDNGWYRSVPEYFLGVVQDPDVTETNDGEEFTVPGSGGAENPWRYRFDDGDEVDCGAVFACLIEHPEDGVPTIGEHTLHFTGVDAVGNRFDDVPFVAGQPDAFPSPMQTIGPLFIDGVDPTSTLITAPRAADGEGGWFVSDPFVVLSAVDQPGASGIREIRYRILPSTDEIVYDGPFQLGAGSHSLCWYAVDVAGNEEAEQCTAAPINVDLADPVVSLTVDPAAPQGDDGIWYTSEPTVELEVTDAVPGSGVDPAALLVSVDGGEFVTYTGPITIGEGDHVVRSYATDLAGRRSAVVEQVLHVDVSLPVASHSIVPPLPARDGWYRRVPTLVLRATDGEQNSGLDTIEYRIDGGSFETYTGPIDLTAGTHTITYRAIDRAGRVGASTTFSVRTDTGMPTAQALQPNPLIWSKLLGPANAKLNWTVGDDRSGQVRITVLVVDVLGNTIRRLDGGTKTVTPGSTVTGFTNWDGKNDAGTAVTGLFHYRVIVTDEAGNKTQSGESRPIQIKLL